MAFFRTCPRCGANLDPGERCDCEKAEKERDDTYAQMIRVDSKTGQLTFLVDKERKKVMV